MCMAIPYQTAKFKFANIFAIAILGSTAKFNSRQYFWLYGTLYFLLFVYCSPVSCIPASLPRCMADQSPPLSVALGQLPSLSCCRGEEGGERQATPTTPLCRRGLGHSRESTLALVIQIAAVRREKK